MAIAWHGAGSSGTTAKTPDGRKEGRGTPVEVERTAIIPFSVGYNRSQGEPIVFGCLLLGLLFAVVGLAGGVPFLAVAALVPLAIAFWHTPMIEKGASQLGASGEGLFVERIGVIDWDAIDRIDVKRTAVRSIELTRLEILLACPFENAIARAQTLPAWKGYTMRNWKKSQGANGQETIVVNLHTLAADPQAVLDRLSFAFPDSKDFVSYNKP